MTPCQQSAGTLWQTQLSQRVVKVHPGSLQAVIHHTMLHSMPTDADTVWHPHRNSYTYEQHLKHSIPKLARSHGQYMTVQQSTGAALITAVAASRQGSHCRLQPQGYRTVTKQHRVSLCHNTYKHENRERCATQITAHRACIPSQTNYKSHLASKHSSPCTSLCTSDPVAGLWALVSAVAAAYSCLNSLATLDKTAQSVQQ